MLSSEKRGRIKRKEQKKEEGLKGKSKKMRKD